MSREFFWANELNEIPGPQKNCGSQIPSPWWTRERASGKLGFAVVGRFLRKVIAGLVIGGVLASCSEGSEGSKASSPSSAERVICKTVRTQLDPSIPMVAPSTHPAAVSEEGTLGIASAPSSNVAFFVRTSFIQELTRSHDVLFENVAKYERSDDPGSFVAQLDKGCSALGL